MTSLAAAADADVAAALNRASRAGFRLMLLGRTVVLTLMLAWAGGASLSNGNATGPALTVASLALGLAVLATLGTAAERVWHRFALVAVDLVAVAAVASTAPLLAGAEVPQGIVFRAYGMGLLWFAPVVTALALSPALTAFAGVAAGATVWAIYIAVSAPMPRVLSWADLPEGATATDYMALLLDPAFLGRGNRIEESVALAVGGAMLALAVHRARRLVAAHAAETARRRRVEDVFGRHVPPVVAARLIETPDAFAPTIHDATVLHLDAAGFTTFALGRDPAEVLAALDDLLGRAAAAIAGSGGVVVSYGGDSLLAAFGAPLADPHHAARALSGARAVLEAVEGAPMGVRIGLASGPVAAGLVGGSARQAFTLYGETVNLAQRLEQACKAAGGRLMLSQATVEGLGSVDSLEPVMLHGLPGLAGPVSAYLAA